MRIAVDAMGGDNAPKEIVKGCLRAAREFSDVTLVLYGKEEAIRNELSEDLPNIEIVHSEEVVKSDDDPVRSIRRKKRIIDGQSSLLSEKWRKPCFVLRREYRRASCCRNIDYWPYERDRSSRTSGDISCIIR